MLPRDGTGLPRGRQQVMPWLMALARLGVGWIVIAASVYTLLEHGSFMPLVAGPLARYADAAALLGGLALFAWPPTCRWGFALLLAGIAGFELLWRHTGFVHGRSPLWAVAILTVLALGEWLSRRVRTRLYR